MNGITVTIPTIAADDRTIEIGVEKALAWHFWIPKDRIRTSVKNGEVVLSGNVEWLFQKTGCEDAVRGVPGVKSVVNRIVVDPRSPRYYPREVASTEGKHHKGGR